MAALIGSPFLPAASHISIYDKTVTNGIYSRRSGVDDERRRYREPGYRQPFAVGGSHADRIQRADAESQMRRKKQIAGRRYVGTSVHLDTFGPHDHRTGERATVGRRFVRNRGGRPSGRIRHIRPVV